MDYNFIKKMKDNEFSLKEDLYQTLDDFSGWYRIVGLKKAMTGLEKIFGKLEKKDRTVAITMYLASAYFATCASEQYLRNVPELGNPFIKIAGTVALINLYHHFRVGDRTNSTFKRIDKN